MARSRNKRKRAARSTTARPASQAETNWHRAGRLISTISCGGVALLVFESAAVAGVVDMTLAYVLLAVAWAIGLATIVVAVRSWPVPRRHQLLSGVVSGIVLTAMLLSVGWYETTHRPDADIGARIQVTGYKIHRPNVGEKLFLNTFLKNQGALAATQYRSGFAMGYADKLLSDTELDSLAENLYRKLETRDRRPGEMQPGEEWFVSFPPPNYEESPGIDQWRRIVALKNYLYILGVIEYSDSNLSGGATRLTEWCVFIWGDAIHNCLSHNNIYESY